MKKNLIYLLLFVFVIIILFMGVTTTNVVVDVSKMIPTHHLFVALQCDELCTIFIKNKGESSVMISFRLVQENQGAWEENEVVYQVTRLEPQEYSLSDVSVRGVGQTLFRLVLEDFQSKVVIAEAYDVLDFPGYDPIRTINELKINDDGGSVTARSVYNTDLIIQGGVVMGVFINREKSPFITFPMTPSHPSQVISFFPPKGTTLIELAEVDESRQGDRAVLIYP